jgi:hypothetical protein
MTFRKTRFALILAAFSVSGIIGVAPLVAEEFKRITTEAKFNQLVVGRKLGFNDSYFIIKKNGTLKGKFGGKALKGNWAWRDGYWCRTLSTHSKNTDCQVWAVSGDKFYVTRERGKGKSFTYVAN